jgi:hypothetical protein
MNNTGAGSSVPDSGTTSGYGSTGSTSTDYRAAGERG